MSTKTHLDLFKFYAELGNHIRRLLVTQTFAWLAGFLYFALEATEVDVRLLVCAALVACAFTYSFGLTFRYLHGFLEDLVVQAKQSGEEPDVWALLHRRRHDRSGWELFLLNHPDLIPMASFLAAAAMVYSAKS
ncbi:MAG: hypothetical protein AAF682_30365 [Planctomycetota bacterium]